MQGTRRRHFPDLTTWGALRGRVPSSQSVRGLSASPRVRVSVFSALAEVRGSPLPCHTFPVRPMFKTGEGVKAPPSSLFLTRHSSGTSRTMYSCIGLRRATCPSLGPAALCGGRDADARERKKKVPPPPPSPPHLQLCPPKKNYGDGRGAGGTEDHIPPGPPPSAGIAQRPQSTARPINGGVRIFLSCHDLVS